MNPNLNKIAWGLWLTFSLCTVLFADHQRTVSFRYWITANHWLAEQPLYQNNGRGFIYLPQSAVLYTALAKLPFALSEAVWRLLSLSLFSWGLYRFTALLTDQQPHKLPGFFLLL